jgi:hypothetical protein
MHAAASTHWSAFARAWKPNIEHIGWRPRAAFRNIYEESVSCLPRIGKPGKGMNA